jgi:hypothetical protein
MHAQLTHLAELAGPAADSRQPQDTPPHGYTPSNSACSRTLIRSSRNPDLPGSTCSWGE